MELYMYWTFEELRQLGFGFVSGSTNQKFKTILNENNIKKIENIDLNNTTCKEAFDILYNIQQNLKNIQ